MSEEQKNEQAAAADAGAATYSAGDKILFWGCFIALITTAFAFITRAFLINIPTLWPASFGLDNVQGQELFGAGIWPFAISIIIFSLIIDRIGYKTAMIFSFICYGGYAAMAFTAHGIVTGVVTSVSLGSGETYSSMQSAV